MVAATSVDHAVAEAQARSGAYALLASIWRYPDDANLPPIVEIAERLAVEGWLERFDPPVRAAFASLVGHLFNGDTNRLAEELRGAYACLFGHAVRGACPLYELEYNQGEIVQQASELADIAGFYSAFGLQTNEDSAERLDHISAECEFMSVLCAKQALGDKSGDVELSESAYDAQRAFLRDHLSRWLPAFCSRVRKCDGDGVYAKVADFAQAFLNCECRSFAIQAGPAYLKLRPVDPQADVEINCGEPGGEAPLVPLTVHGESPEER